MPKFIRIILSVLILALIAGTGYALLQFAVIRNQIQVLENSKALLFADKMRLNETLAGIELEKQKKDVQIDVLKKELAGLEDARNLRDMYLSGQEQLKKINAEFSVMEKDTRQLRQENLTLNSRLENLTKEFTRSLDNLKATQKQLEDNKSDKLVRSYSARAEKSEANLKDKENEIAGLKQAAKKLQSESVVFEKERKSLENKISQLAAERDRLRGQIEKGGRKADAQPKADAELEKKIQNISKELSERESQRRELNKEVVMLRRDRVQLDEKIKNQEARILELSKELSARDSQGQELNKEVVGLRRDRIQFEQKIKYQDDRLAELEKELAEVKTKTGFAERIEQEKKNLEIELFRAKETLNQQAQIIAGLEKNKGVPDINEMPAMDTGTSLELQDKLNKAYALYDTAKAQVVKFTELLMGKEVELDTSRKKIQQLEEELKKTKEQAVPGDSNDYYSLWKDRIKVLNDSLQEKEGMLNRKEEEIAALKMAKSTLEERIRYQEKESGDAGSMYANLKSQMQQSTELLARREMELINRNKEVLDLKSELAILQAEYKVKAQEVKDIEDRYRRTMDDLSRSTQLNMNLQENMANKGRDSAVESEEKKKADELKRELELLMGR